MRRLKLVGLSADGQQVVYCDDAGGEFTAPADERLRAALRGDRARLGQLEIEMHSALRPRDIQARIRAGETPEGVAALAGVSVDKVMPYCVPVLAERQHIAELAGRSHVRRKGVEGPTRRLDDVVVERLRSRGVDVTAVEWDAWRRDDGRWNVEAAYHSGESARTATFVFDAGGRFSVADDDEAKWLTGERQTSSKGPQPRESAQRPAERRLASVPPAEDLLTLSELVGFESLDADSILDRLEPVDPASDADAEPTVDVPVLHGGEPDDESADNVAVADEAEPVPAAADVEGDDLDVTDDLTAVVRAVREAEPTQPQPAQPEPRRRSTKRASVPSWDEIMLGRRSER